MKTGQWIDLLSADAAPVDTHAPDRRLAVTCVLGTAVAAILAIELWGQRSFDAQDLATPMLWVRWAFCLAVMAVAWQAFDRLARPGRPLKGLAFRLAVPFMLLAVLALLQMLSAQPQDRFDLLMGSSALECPTNIALVAAPVFMTSLWVMSRMAPTRPALAGAAAGLLAGSVGALGYTFHCTELAAPFLSVWYVLGMAIPVALGALLGSRVLRW